MKRYINTHMNTLLVVFALILSNIGMVQAASPPTTINYQGYLTDDSSNAITGTVGILVKVYDASSGGSLLYTEIHSSVSVSSGQFSILIGSQNQSGAGTTWSSVDFGLALWLDITIDSDNDTTVAADATVGGATGDDETLSSRVPLEPAPYARMALDVADSVTINSATINGAALSGTITGTPTFSDAVVLTQPDINGGTVDDAYLSGTITGSPTFSDAVVLTQPDINGGSVDGAAIGFSSASTGAFTSLQTSSTTTLNAGLAVKNGATSAGAIEIYEDTDDGLNKVTIQAQALSTDYTLTLPTDDGTNGQFLSTDGSGSLSWTSAGGGGGGGDITDVGDSAGPTAFTGANDGNSLTFEGSTDDTNEITLTAADPGADFIITLPATTGMVVTTGDTGTVTSTMILDGMITAADIASSAVTTDKILDGTIAAADIANDAITLALMAPGTDGNLITYDASGNPAAVATGSSGQVLTSNGAGAAPTFQAAGGGGGGDNLGDHTATQSLKLYDATAESIPCNAGNLGYIVMGIADTDWKLPCVCLYSGTSGTSSYKWAAFEGAYDCSMPN
ncbi:MAG: hypothetical protein GY737_32270 [Desulfobacteraceae bacterium]|nr:hypothetical protein [Desulfobacteraceae bacterium]